MIALVTGAAQGIGAAVVRALVDDGYTVAATDVQMAANYAERHTGSAGRSAVDAGPSRILGGSPEDGYAGAPLKRAASPGASGGLSSSEDAIGLSGVGDRAGVRAFALDVRNTVVVERVVRTVEETLGPIEVLVNVAGVLRTGPVLSFSDADWNEVFDVDAAGVFRVSREVARRMVGRRRGAIVTVASNAASVPRAHMAAYAAAKAAAAHFTRCLGVELAPYGIRCNVVSPGSTDTPMQRALWADSEDGAAAVVAGSPEVFKLGVPLGRIADPEDVAAAVAFLASDRARHITLHDLTVDGGASLGS